MSTSSVKPWLLGLGLVCALSIGVNIGLLASRGRTATVDPTPHPAIPTEARAARGVKMAERLARRLGLEGDSANEFVEQQQQFFESTLQARRRVAELQAELHRELLARDPDRESIEARLDSLMTTYGELERAFVHNLLSARELLGPEQQRHYTRFLMGLRRSRGGDFEREMGQPRFRGDGTRRPPWRRGERMRRGLGAKEASPGSPEDTAPESSPSEGELGADGQGSEEAGQEG